MACDYCGRPNGGGSHCVFCEEYWERSLRENDFPTRIRERIGNLPMAKKREIYTYIDSQLIYSFEQRYGFYLSCVNGDESKVEPQREEMEKNIRQIIDNVFNRYEIIINGKPDPVKQKQEELRKYQNIRYGRDL